MGDKPQKPRYLTKSLYKIGRACPTRLYYTKKPTEYADKSLDDPFLKALAEGGFQVGALAQCYYPEGIGIETLDHDEAVRQTEEYLQRDQVVLFEPALRFENLFVRADILVKDGNHVRLIEVKAKSFDPDSLLEEIWGKAKGQVKPPALRKNILSSYREYIFDIAFQTYVLQKAHPEFSVTPFLMGPDKSRKTTVDGLNQKFFLVKDGKYTSVKTEGDVSPLALGEKILIEADMSEPVNLILSGQEQGEEVSGLSFEEEIELFSQSYFQDEKINIPIGAQCKHCQFRCSAEGLKNGFQECMKAQGVKPHDLDGPFVFDVWNYKRTQSCMDQGKILMCHLTEDDFGNNQSEDPFALSYAERQKKQVQMQNECCEVPYCQTEGLKNCIEDFEYPLHFIDFETSRVAIPFSAGKRPYEQIAFQFSHHVLEKDGTIRHMGQYINLDQGYFPNFDFVRALKKELHHDEGTIFRYSHHENTVLCDIHSQLAKSTEPDKDELMAFIETITTKKDPENKGEFLWQGKRNMVDLCELVIKYYMHPSIVNGSNSIKYVLPAILNESKFLQNKYSKNIYGKQKPISSLNMDEKTWIQFEGKEVLDPYKQLDPVFTDYDRTTLDLLMPEDEIQNGGAAMTAYARCQFTKMSIEERQKIKEALLKYCELDTLAMVMIYEYWLALLRGEERRVA
ncbi:MAG: DUF2779 domain-containing protein [Bdellovibrionales bacterium]|nr:DUF2779 domain-containing protein [Bdellovibrionales bacterium]